MKKQIRKIYVYSTNDALRRGFVKIGQTIDQEVDDRINQQDSTSNYEPLIRVQNSNGEPLQFETYLSDSDIRKALFAIGYDEVRKDKSREWVGGFETLTENGDEIELKINQIIAESGRDTRKSYSPYFYKKYIQAVFFEMLKLSKSSKQKVVDIAMELAPRFGKTTFAINEMLIPLFKRNRYRIAVLPSYWLSSLSSFEKDLNRYKGFDKLIVYVGRDESLTSAIKKWYGKKMIVVELSLHLSDEKFDKMIRTLKRIPPKEKLTIIDEADFGVPRTSQIDKIKSLGCSLNVYMSGSGLDKVTAPLENIDGNIIRWSYTDMLLVKDGLHPLFFNVEQNKTK
jgi:hypothetical protein